MLSGTPCNQQPDCQQQGHGNRKGLRAPSVQQHTAHHATADDDAVPGNHIERQRNIGAFACAVGKRGLQQRRRAAKGQAPLPHLDGQSA
ncbi:hypothetical protein [Xanthomonas arboricola]|uniref:Uncharacterized protein n=2 Tax=Xanthomonas arboricola pv. pruni TaxID=69929 RepID=A0AAP4KAN4_9XANT|nr:hypothetical protein [Xanthomonas arboricola]MDN0267031.1 hypothetical protein [Xanthomonas arboricola pv. pruni]MDN0270989.1 hypothetical protein [Xanthomonas arboricola pv. pruni]MDN0275330.1 hypothetical protein [Xanthomonas arboricola pv. pruni]MDN0283584.1 hypothetical protein [Xanthomonas arboricola pv. pruni]MDN0287551.1 hypothetical protein [Xanthomonas arboricola pv. pruni]